MGRHDKRRQHPFGGRETIFSEDSITHFRVVAGLGWTQWEKKVGTDEIRTREVSHHGLVST